MAAAVAVTVQVKRARVRSTDGFREGTIDFASATWNCAEHGTKMRVGRECAFCAVDRHGDSVLDDLAF